MMIENKFDVRRQIFRVWGPIPGEKKVSMKKKPNFFPFSIIEEISIGHSSEIVVLGHWLGKFAKMSIYTILEGVQK